MVVDQTELERIESFAVGHNLPVVAVQGLGFVGTAMVAALVHARHEDGSPCFKVIGVDVDTEEGRKKIDKINQAQPAIVSSDEHIDAAIKQGWMEGRLLATASTEAYQYADIVVVDINLDVQKHYSEETIEYAVDLSTYRHAIEALADSVKEDVLVVVESTVPPGMTERVIYPIFKATFERRGLDIEHLSLVHSYERVMPGANYLRSITDYYRVFAGMTPSASKRARDFFEQFINVNEFPLTELDRPRASEISKVLENSYRAMNIAFIQEWTEFAGEAGINLFDVLQAIKKRHTHNNIMSPGFGVGGYCLTKDSLLADWGKTNLFGSTTHLEKSVAAIQTNDRMPLYTFQLLKKAAGNLAGKTIALMGVSYLNDVADTRSTPAKMFVEACTAEGATVLLHDSFVDFWPEMDLVVSNDLKELSQLQPEIVVLAVRHTEYIQLSATQLVELFPGARLFVDANNLIDDEKAALLTRKGVKLVGVGKGHWERVL